MAPVIRRCYCADCDFSFYDQRLDDAETAALYRDYRGTAYRELRQRLEPGSECALDLHEDRANAAHQSRIQYTAKLLAKWGVESCRVLDYGGEADGWLARALFPSAEVWSWDLSSNMPPPSKGYFDLVICAHVLEHVSFPRAFLEEIKAFLAPGGVLYAEVPSDTSGPLGTTLLKGHPLNRVHEHLSFFSPRALSRLFISSGLKPIGAAAFRAEPFLKGIAVLGRLEFASADGSWDIPDPDPAEDIHSPILVGLFKRVDEVARAWKVEGLRVALYPSGSYSMELLAKTSLDEVVVALGDGNPSLQGQVHMGRVIHSLQDLVSQRVSVILIASPLHEEAIARDFAALNIPNVHIIRASQI